MSNREVINRKKNGKEKYDRATAEPANRQTKDLMTN